MLPNKHMARINLEPPEDMPKNLNAIETIKPRQYVC